MMGAMLVLLFALQCAVAGPSAVYVVSIGLELLDIGPSGVGCLEGINRGAVMELSDMDEASALCVRYAEILGGTLELDLRVVDQSDDAE